jgi:hypothetical protein
MLNFTKKKLSNAEKEERLRLKLKYFEIETNRQATCTNQ